MHQFHAEYISDDRQGIPCKSKCKGHSAKIPRSVFSKGMQDPIQSFEAWEHLEQYRISKL